MRASPRQFRRTLAVEACLALALGLGCRTMPTPAADRAAILALLDQQVGAWNRGDLNGFLQGYWHSKELVYVSGGRIARGFPAVAEHYAAAYAEPTAMGRLSMDGLEIRFLRPHAAAAHGQWRLERTGADGTPETLAGAFSLVLHRFGERWRIIHDHTSTRSE